MKDQRTARSISLPVARTAIRPSRMGWKRAAVLIAVHVIFAIHIVHWRSSGSTISPLEPSEAMEFTKHGVVNAGFVFFALAIGSTLVLGRWFCGWGCHLVALQDLSRWLLGLMRIRPRPIRSIVLSAVPLLAFIYMFIMPLLDVPALKLAGIEPGEGAKWAFGGTKLTTDSFWATFPGVMGAILTLLVCGFIIIYVLGAKGFCTTGCPYGAIFGAADRFAPLRIRVNEDCTQSGHCTAVCSSNVRVHDEVRRFGMVVDPGCMKCLDCVSVCPNEALSVGWGATAIAPRQESPVRVQRGERPRGRESGGAVATWALLASFCVAAMAVFHGYDTHVKYVLTKVDWIFAGLGAALSLVILALFRARRAGPRESTLAEEGLLAVFFLAGMAVFRGLGNLVPFLFALGLAAITAWILTQTCLLVSRRQLSALGFRLKREGRLQPAAAGFLAVAAGLVGLMGFGTVETSRFIRAGFLRVEYGKLLPRVSAETVAPDDLERAIAIKKQLADLDPGQLDHVFDLARLTALAGRLDEVPQIYEAVLARPSLIKGDAARTHFEYAMFESVRRNPAAVVDRLSRAVADAPEWPNARVMLGQALADTGELNGAAEQFAVAVRLLPDNADIRMMLAECYFRLGRPVDARREVEAAAKLAPEREDIRAALQQMP